MVRNLVASAATAFVMVAGLAPVASAFEPEKPECVAPAGQGGGWDFTCRSVGKIMYDLGYVSTPVQVVNMPGGSGAVAWANISSKREDDPNLFVATSAVAATMLAQDRYPSGPDAVKWLAMLGADSGVVLVSQDSPYTSLEDLITALSEDPSSVVAGGSSAIGGWDHLRYLLAAKAGGMSGDALKEMRWVQYDGGSPAVTQMMGGHVDVVVTDIGEIAGFIESGDAVGLAVMSEERLPAFPDVPTAIEQGYDMVGYNWRGFYLPGEVDQETYDGWLDVMAQLFESDEWQQTAEQNGLTPIYNGGESFNTFVLENVEAQRELSREIGVIQ
ncbi:MAG: tripartite tricarboxylate transporter substrate-binding protein [Pseudomonadota bacterium]